MKRWPLVPTLLVAAAIAAMIGLGVWQLERKGEKERLIALYAANLQKPEMAFPKMGPVPDDAMFRRATAHCLSVAGWTLEGGRAQSGGTGYRRIAECRTGAEGPGLLVDMGVSPDPKLAVQWTGGPVSGWVTTEPDHSSAFAKLLGRQTVLRPLLVSAVAAPGLQLSEPPRLDAVPNNHLAYAVQWFLFAGVAGLIYYLALRRRWRKD